MNEFLLQRHIPPIPFFDASSLPIISEVEGISLSKGVGSFATRVKSMLKSCNAYVRLSLLFSLCMRTFLLKA